MWSWTFWIPVGISIVQTILMIWQLRQPGITPARGVTPARGAAKRPSSTWRYWPIAVMAILMLGTWVPYFLADEPPLRRVMKVPAIIVGGQAGGDPCTADVDGTQLMRYRATYDVVLVCGIDDQAVDKYKDARITVSRPYTIREGTISISLPYSNSLAAAVQTMREQRLKESPPPPPGKTFFILVKSVRGGLSPCCPRVTMPP